MWWEQMKWWWLWANGLGQRVITHTIMDILDSQSTANTEQIQDELVRRHGHKAAQVDHRLVMGLMQGMTRLNITRNCLDNNGLKWQAGPRFTLCHQRLKVTGKL